MSNCSTRASGSTNHCMICTSLIPRRVSKALNFHFERVHLPSPISESRNGRTMERREVEWNVRCLRKLRGAWLRDPKGRNNFCPHFLPNVIVYTQKTRREKTSCPLETFQPFQRTLCSNGEKTVQANTSPSSACLPANNRPERGR